MLKEKKRKKLSVVLKERGSFLKNHVIVDMLSHKSVLIFMILTMLFMGCNSSGNDEASTKLPETPPEVQDPGTPLNPTDPIAGTCETGIENCIGNFLVIRSQPLHTSVEPDEDAVFSVNIDKLNAAQPGTIIYEWQMNTKGRTDWRSIAGVSGNTYRVPRVTFAGDNGRAVRLKACLSTDVQERNCVYTRAAVIQVNRTWRGTHISGYAKPRNIVISNDGLSALVAADQLRPLTRSNQASSWSPSANPINLSTDGNARIVSGVVFLDNNNALISSNDRYLYSLQKTATGWNTVGFPVRLSPSDTDGVPTSIVVVSPPLLTKNFALVSTTGRAPNSPGSVFVLSADKGTTTWTSVLQMNTGDDTQDIAVSQSLQSLFVVNRCFGTSINCGSNVKIYNLDPIAANFINSLTAIQIGSIVSNQENLLARSRSVVLAPNDLSAYIGSRNGPVIEIARTSTTSVDWRSVGSLPNSNSTAKVLVSSDNLSVYFVNPNDNTINFIVRATPQEPWISAQPVRALSLSSTEVGSQGCGRSSLDGYGMAIAPDGNSILISCTGAADGTGTYGIVHYSL